MEYPRDDNVFPALPEDPQRSGASAFDDVPVDVPAELGPRAPQDGVGTVDLHAPAHHPDTPTPAGWNGSDLAAATAAAYAAFAAQAFAQPPAKSPAPSFNPHFDPLRNTRDRADSMAEARDDGWFVPPAANPATTPPAPPASTPPNHPDTTDDWTLSSASSAAAAVAAVSSAYQRATQAFAPSVDGEAPGVLSDVRSRTADQSRDEGEKHFAYPAPAPAPTPAPDADIDASRSPRRRVAPLVRELEACAKTAAASPNGKNPASGSARMMGRMRQAPSMPPEQLRRRAKNARRVPWWLVALGAALPTLGVLWMLSVEPSARERYEKQAAAGAPEEAFRSLEAAARRRHYDAPLQLFLYETAVKAGHRASAVEAASRLAALARDPSRQAYWLALRGDQRSRLGEHGLAIADLEEALRLDPDSALCQRHRAEAAWRAGQADEALVRLRALTEAGDPEAWLALGRVALARGDGDQAALAYARYRRQAPLTELVLLENGLVLAAAGKEDELRELCRAARRDGPARSPLDAPDAPNSKRRSWSPMAEAYLLLWEGQDEKAARSFAKLLRGEPENPWLLRASVELAARRGDHAGALAHARALAKNGPERVENALLVARQARAAGETTLSDSTYLRLLDAHPEDVELVHEYVEVLQAEGRDKEARTWMKLAGADQRAEPSFEAPAGPAGAGIVDACGSLRLASSVAETRTSAASAAPANIKATASDTLEHAGREAAARALEQRRQAQNLWNGGQRAEALAAWEKLAGQNPDDIGVLAELARAYVHEGRAGCAAALVDARRFWPARLDEVDREHLVAVALALDNQPLLERLLSMDEPPPVPNTSGAAPVRVAVSAPLAPLAPSASVAAAGGVSSSASRQVAPAPSAVVSPNQQSLHARSQNGAAAVVPVLATSMAAPEASPAFASTPPSDGGVKASDGFSLAMEPLPPGDGRTRVPSTEELTRQLLSGHDFDFQAAARRRRAQYGAEPVPGRAEIAASLTRGEAETAAVIARVLPPPSSEQIEEELRRALRERIRAEAAGREADTPGPAASPSAPTRTPGTSRGVEPVDLASDPISALFAAPTGASRPGASGNVHGSRADTPALARSAGGGALRGGATANQSVMSVPSRASSGSMASVPGVEVLSPDTSLRPLNPPPYR